VNATSLWFSLGSIIFHFCITLVSTIHVLYVCKYNFVGLWILACSLVTLEFNLIGWRGNQPNIEMVVFLVRDVKLPNDGGEIPKSQGRGWRFESRLWNLLFAWQKNLPGGQPSLVLWQWPIGLMSQKRWRWECSDIGLVADYTLSSLNLNTKKAPLMLCSIFTSSGICFLVL
jgi:hypothetical protein